MLGARPLKRSLQKYLESPLASSLLAGNYKEGDTLTVEKGEGDELVFVKTKSQTVEEDTLSVDVEQAEQLVEEPVEIEPIE